MAGCYKGEGQKKLGKYLDFDRATFKPFLLGQLKIQWIVKIVQKQTQKEKFTLIYNCG